MKQNISILVIFCGITSLPAFVSTGLGAIYPALKLTLNLTGMQVGFLFSTATIATIMAAPIFGYIADRRGLFQTILPLLFLYVSGSITCGLSSFANVGQFWYLIVGRMLEGLGTVGAVPLVISLAKSLWGDRGIFPIAWIEASISLGAVAGPLIGGMVADVGWFWLFWLEGSIMFTLALFLVIIVQLHKEELNREKSTLYSSHPIPVHKSFPSLITIGACLGGSALSFSLVGMQLYIIDYF
ncbi:MAG: MFS transporter, partial [Thermoplasmata archaeon]|nr:MFS transporter [Thermoplasmata archaeon]